MKQEKFESTIEHRLRLLKRSSLLRHWSNTMLLYLLQAGQEQTCGDGATPLLEKGDVLLVLQGLVSVNTDTANESCLSAGDLIGMDASPSGKLRSIGSTQLLRFSRESLHSLAQVYTPWRQSPAWRRLEHTSSSRPLAKRAEVVTFENRVDSVSPRLLAVLTHLVAKEISQSFHETVNVLSGPESGFPLGGTSFIPGRTGVKYTSMLLKPGASSGGKSDSADYVFRVNNISISSEDVVLAENSTTPKHTHKKVYLTNSNEPPTPAPNREVPPPTSTAMPTIILPTVLLNKGPLPSGGLLKGTVPTNTDDLLLAPCRTRFNWELLERLSPSDVLNRQLDELKLDKDTRDSLARWARAITSRRVGVGLAGGGAWGFYHVALLRKLLSADIPIDIISGASMGSLVAAAYSTQGADGLNLLVDLASGDRLSAVALLSIGTTWPIELLVNLMFGSSYFRLEELLTIFHPVTTDLSTGLGVKLAEGPLGLAVRASSSAPGIFGPTLQLSSRYVDGCVSNNLPITALLDAGADFTFACNCYPAAYRAHSQLVPGWFGAVFSTLNPLGRVQDLLASGSIALSNMGVQSALLANVAYDPKPQQSPFWEATLFKDVTKIIEQAMNDTLLDEAIMRFKYIWSSTIKPVDVLPPIQEET